MHSRELLTVYSELPEHEAVRLLALATGRRTSAVLLGCEVTSRERDAFEGFVERRLANEPLQYIEGSAPFGPADLHIELLLDERVLIPRPETEYMFEQVVALVEAPSVIVDLCTGSGNLALALKAHFSNAEVYAVDVSCDAADVARENAVRNNLNIEVFVGDLFAPLPNSLRGSVDLLVANPPYLAQGELAELPPDVLAEPERALVAGSSGDEVLVEIAEGADDWLSPGGFIACEISEFQGSRAVGLFNRYNASIVTDLEGRDRYVMGSREMR